MSELNIKLIIGNHTAIMMDYKEVEEAGSSFDAGQNDANIGSSSTNCDNVKSVKVDPPYPPHWNTNLEFAENSLNPYELFQIPSESLEHKTLAALLKPLKIKKSELIINPHLWSRFLNARKHMLQSKTDDLLLLSKLTSDERTIAHQIHVSFNFKKDSAVAASPYSDNLALLFHCTRSAANADSILIQGLDERLGRGGLLGKGIYFADNPAKSVAYDGCGGIMFICLVYLGDCLSVDQTQGKVLVREPEKKREEQRNLHDLSYDSIVSRIGNYNEYVVFNRYQCYPLYKISYQGGATAQNDNDLFSAARSELPPFSWLQKPGSASKPSSLLHTHWPFYAENIFTQMGSQPVLTVEEKIVPIPESAESIKEKMTNLFDLGFTDEETNMKTLKKHSYDIDKSINELLELVAVNSQPSEAEIADKMKILSNLGFTNVEANNEALTSNDFDIDRSVNRLLGQGGMDDQPTESEILTNNMLAILSDLGFTNVEENKRTLKRYQMQLDATVNHLLNAMTGTTPENVIMEVAKIYLTDYKGQVSARFKDKV